MVRPSLFNPDDLVVQLKWSGHPVDQSDSSATMFLARLIIIIHESTDDDKILKRLIDRIYRGRMT